MTATTNVNAHPHAGGANRDAAVFQRLKVLLADYPKPCLSLYQPTFRAFPDSQQNTVKYRNALRELRAKVDSSGISADTATLLEPFERLQADRDFWSHPQDGIAAFGAAGFFHVEKVQSTVPEATMVGDHLHIKPLVRIFQSNDSYQILALDRRQVKLYQGNRYALDEVMMAPGVPRTIEEALGPYVARQGIERTQGGGTGRASATAHHGHGSKTDDVDIDIERFFRAVDRATCEAHSKASELPLILAALPEYHTQFRAISHNGFLLDEGIHGNADALSRDELRDQAWRLMEPRYHRRLQQTIDMYHAAKVRTLATDDLTHAAEFATDGRVGTLILEADRRIPGHLDGHIPRRAALNDDPLAGDVLDDIAERVLKTGGQVIVAPRDSMPTATGLAAIFRY